MKIPRITDVTNLTKLVIVGLVAATLVGDVAAEPAPVANGAVTDFTSITFSDSGGFTGRGSGKWLSIDGTGKMKVKRGSGPAIDVQLDKEQLADLAKEVAAIDWSEIEERYPARGADMIQNDLVVIIAGKTHEVHATTPSKEIPASVSVLFARLNAFYQKHIAPKK